MPLSRFIRAAMLTPLLGLGFVGGAEPKSPVVEKKAEKTCGAFGTSVEFARQPHGGRHAGQEGREAGLHPARHRELRRPALHLKQRRSAPCERSGQPRSRQVPQRILRLSLPESRYLPHRRRAKTGRQRRGVFLRPDGRVLHVRRRAGGRRHACCTKRNGSSRPPRRRWRRARATAASSRPISARLTPSGCATNTAWWSSRSRSIRRSSKIPRVR